MVAWTRNRVVNFSRDFAVPYVKALVELDGQPYDQARFFKRLVDAGIVGDVPQGGGEEEIARRRSTRWDSYLGKIREFGIGFAVDERRKGGPTVTTWRASDIAKDFAAGRLDYRQFMALQCMRQQLPKPAMPLQPQARAELERGVRMLRPLALVIDALDGLDERGAGAYLSREEVSWYLTTVERRDQLDEVLDDIAAARGGTSTGSDPAAEGRGTPREAGGSDEEAAGQASIDIWLNEFEATGYVRQLRPSPGGGTPSHIVVKGRPRWEEAKLLEETVPLQEYDTSSLTIDAYFSFLGASPSDRELEVLTMNPQVIELEVPSEARFDPSGPTLSGDAETIGELKEGLLVLLVGETLKPRVKATIFEVTSASPGATGSSPSVRLRSAMLRADMNPISTGEAG